jgi:hypothetical protein
LYKTSNPNVITAEAEGATLKYFMLIISHIGNFIASFPEKFRHRFNGPYNQLETSDLGMLVMSFQNRILTAKSWYAEF